MIEEIKKRAREISKGDPVIYEDILLLLLIEHTADYVDDLRKKGFVPTGYLIRKYLDHK